MILNQFKSASSCIGRANINCVENLARRYGKNYFIGCAVVLRLINYNCELLSFILKEEMLFIFEFHQSILNSLEVIVGINGHVVCSDYLALRRNFGLCRLFCSLFSSSYFLLTKSSGLNIPLCAFHNKSKIFITEDTLFAKLSHTV